MTSPQAAPRPERGAVVDPGVTVLRIDLGGTTAEVCTPDHAWRAYMERRYAGFLTPEEPDLALIHRPHAPGPAIEPGPTDRSFFLNRAAVPEHVDGFLTSLLPELAAPGLLVHAAMLGDGARGYLCCGCSGAGKSTLAALLPGRALCDELALVRARATSVEASSLPYWTARRATVPLAGVFLLEHGPEHRRTRIEPGAAARALRRHVYWPTEDPGALRGAFSTLAAVVSGTPVWRLAFRPDPGVWSVISEPG